MKQHISVEMVSELTPEQKQKLREWWKPAGGDWFYGSYGGPWQNGRAECGGAEIDVYLLSNQETDSGVYGPSTYSEALPDMQALPLLTIPQCMELLGYKLQWIACPKPPRTEEEQARLDALKYAIPGIQTYTPDIWVLAVYGLDPIESTELIDALWAAIKAVL